MVAFEAEAEAICLLLRLLLRGRVLSRDRNAFFVPVIPIGRTQGICAVLVCKRVYTLPILVLNRAWECLNVFIVFNSK